jgi:hypothetical protein
MTAVGTGGDLSNRLSICVPPGKPDVHDLRRALQRQGHPKIVSETASQKRSSRPALCPLTPASPAGLTARARPESRPERRTANLPSMQVKRLLRDGLLRLGLRGTV